MTNGLRNHPGNRKGLLRDYLIAMSVVVFLAFAIGGIVEALFF